MIAIFDGWFLFVLLVHTFATLGQFVVDQIRDQLAAFVLDRIAKLFELLKAIFGDYLDQLIALLLQITCPIDLLFVFHIDHTVFHQYLH